MRGVRGRAAEREIRRTGSVALVRSAALSRAKRRSSRGGAGRAARRLAPSARACVKCKTVPLPPSRRRGTVLHFTTRRRCHRPPPAPAARWCVRPPPARGAPHVVGRDASSAPHASKSRRSSTASRPPPPGRLDPVAAPRVLTLCSDADGATCSASRACAFHHPDHRRSARSGRY